MGVRGSGFGVEYEAMGVQVVKREYENLKKIYS